MSEEDDSKKDINKIVKNVKKNKEPNNLTSESIEQLTTKIANIDISNEKTICESPYKKWIKSISKGIIIQFEEYNRNDYFIPIADIVLDNDVDKSGEKLRQSVIKFVPIISNKEFNEIIEWLYLFTINGEIVKIGGTRNGIKKRVNSYLCGHHIKERGKSGDCSKTNAFIYNTFEFYLNLGYKIQMYGYKLPKTEISIKVFDKEVQITTQTYHVYESMYLGDFKKNYNKYPILNDNCDPNYKG